MLLIPEKNTRLHVVDALRGFAIVSIMLLHNIEHFDFYFTPDNLPLWIQSIDKVIWDTLFFLFGGKSYAIFALLFGLTFFIQSNNYAKKGNDFRARFAWRLLLLLGFGVINSAFYEGDILSIYAIIGIGLIPFAKLNNKVVFISALILMAQPYELYKLIDGIINPVIKLTDPVSWQYFGKAGEYITSNSLIATIKGNLTNGKIAVFYWTWENARVFQTLSLFLLGMLAGRVGMFDNSQQKRQIWFKILIVSAIVFIVFKIFGRVYKSWLMPESVLRPLTTILTSYSNISFMLVLVSGFVILFKTKIFNKILNVFSPMGRMSLSNYIMQSIAGAFIYYGFGLGLYKYTGATYSFLIGIILAILQAVFSKWWFKSHKQGPLEILWHKATWIMSK